MRTLHTYRFTAEHATLSVLETADRAHVTIQMHGDAAQFEEFSVTLAATQWRHLCGFTPFGRHRHGTDVLRAMRFSDGDRGDVLEISETRSAEVILLEMRHHLSVDPDDVLTMFMSRSQWRQFVALDLIGESAVDRAVASFDAIGSNGTVH